MLNLKIILGVILECYLQGAEDGTVGLKLWGDTDCISWITTLHYIAEILSDVLQAVIAGKRFALVFDHQHCAWTVAVR